jgi:hypothetical protein
MKSIAFHAPDLTKLANARQHYAQISSYPEIHPNLTNLESADRRDIQSQHSIHFCEHLL